MKKIILIIFLVFSFLFFARNEVHAQACTGFVKCSAYDRKTFDCSVDQSWVNTIACDGPGCTAGGTCEGRCEVSNGCSSGGGGGGGGGTVCPCGVNNQGGCIPSTGINCGFLLPVSRG